MLFCGVDTSNYTTSLALCDDEGKVVANFKAPLPVKPGECGLRQSDAVFAHIKNLPVLTTKLRAFLTENGDKYGKIAAYGVSAMPRDAENSYMPCFLAGVAAASAMADAERLPLYRFSHQNGHIMAALYSSGAEGLIDSGEHIAFHISGGTTEALLVRGNGDGFSVELIGGTLDLNAGQAVDRAGVLLGLNFPCGPALEALCDGMDAACKISKVSVKDGYCNLSGLQNIIEKKKNNGVSDVEIAAYLFDYLSAVFYKMAECLREKYGRLPIVWAGGVMSNKRIKQRLASLGDCSFAEPQFSADNAAGISLLCRRKHFSVS